MKTVIAIPALLLALSSCIAAPRTEFMGANGKMVYAITCDPSNGCEEEAREVCVTRYDIVPTSSGAADTSAKGGIGDTPTRKMAIQCKEDRPSVASP